MRLHNPHSLNHSEDENPYWMSFSDIMASLLVIFILAAVALILALSEKSDVVSREIQELQKAEQVRKEVLQEIKQALTEKSILVEVADNDTVLRIPESSLRFASGSSDIPEHLQANVQEIGNVMFSVINKKENTRSEDGAEKYRFEYLDTIFIEGHTDSLTYYNSNLKGNWGLSAMRAISVWQFWESDKNQLSSGLAQMKNHSGESLFSMSGYGDTRLACKDITPECHTKNRRIDIRITVKKPTLEDLQNIKGSIKPLSDKEKVTNE